MADRPAADAVRGIRDDPLTKLLRARDDYDCLDEDITNKVIASLLDTDNQFSEDPNTKKETK